jgi:hypothetical protein
MFYNHGEPSFRSPTPTIRSQNARLIKVNAYDDLQ